jgi:AbrB family looped-hinge helix DNA binding protein
MKIGERGQVTIPKDIREHFGLRRDTEVEFHVVGDTLVLRKAPKKLDLARWKGYCRAESSKLGEVSVDDFIEDIRGR